MIKRICNLDQLEFTVVPSQKDLFLKTLTEVKVFKEILPATFLMGDDWNIKINCKKCNNCLTFGRFSSNFKRLKYLSNYDIKNFEFLDYLASPFGHIEVRNYSTKNGEVYNYYFKRKEAIVKLFITFCPQCDATYLGSFAERYGGEIERSPADLSADYVYIDELVMVDVNREKFMEEFKMNT